jgi:hypothetical protein
VFAELTVPRTIGVSDPAFLSVGIMNLKHFGILNEGFIWTYLVLAVQNEYYYPGWPQSD